ncbi:MAG: hypothetical protein JWQ58_1242 [Reyranella sp.]|nr:hypothetical protein [Reyranella sp.]
MKPLSLAGLSLGLGLIAGTTAFAAPPPTAPSSAWDGTYVYEQSLGRGAGGVENFVTHTLKIGGPEGCRLVAQGYQTDDTIRCKAMPDGDRLLVSFVSFGSGKVENKYGVKLYSVDQPLFAIVRTAQGFDTTWQGYSKAAVEGAPSAAFKKQVR